MSADVLATKLIRSPHIKGFKQFISRFKQYKHNAILLSINIDKPIPACWCNS